MCDPFGNLLLYGNRSGLSGKMDLLLIMNPSYNPDNDIAGKANDLK